MINEFTCINYKNPEDKDAARELFKGSKVLKDKEFTDKYLGAYPVIYISLNDFDYPTYDMAYEALAKVVFNIAKEFEFLLDSDAVSDISKKYFKNLLSLEYLKDQSNRIILTSSINDLSRMLRDHYQKNVKVLVDNFDLPLVKASEYGYFKKMINTFGSFMNFLKSDGDGYAVNQTIMTGCLFERINNEITDFNQISFDTSFDIRSYRSTCFGFTKDEVVKLLDDYDMKDCFNLVEANYGGYSCYGDGELFSPISIFNFIKDNQKFVLNNENENVVAGNYWTQKVPFPIRKVDSDLLYRFKKYKDLFQEKSIDEDYLFCSLVDDSQTLNYHSDFVLYLLHSGYLTRLKSNSDKEDTYTFKIPNKEILGVYEKIILKNFSDEIESNKTANIVNALVKGEEEQADDYLFDVLKDYSLLRNFSKYACNDKFYYEFLSRIFESCSNIITEYKSNPYDGNGYANIQFKDLNKSVAVFIEFKECIEEDTLENIEGAFEKIDKNEHIKEFVNGDAIKAVYAYAISFSDHFLYLKKKKIK